MVPFRHNANRCFGHQRPLILGHRSLVVGLVLASLSIVFCTTPSQAQSSPPQNGCVRGTFPNFHDEGKEGTPPEGYDGPLFELSQDYPNELPPMEQYPWIDIDISTLGTDVGSIRYLNALLSYALEGNVQSGWNVQDNPIRDWFHTPWLDASLDGREFVHGLTHELDSSPGLLGPQQTKTAQTWAVGAYNARGGWAIGQIWCDPSNPDPNALNPNLEGPNSFPDGTVVWKLLFTTADDRNAPFLDGSLTWTANIFPKPLPPTTSDPNNPNNQGDQPRAFKDVRLIQMDIAVRDDRLPVGWAFATFAYFDQAEGDGPFERLVPVGLQWGNDPGVTPKMVRSGVRLEQTWINSELRDDHRYPDIHLGWGGRLSGPLDNPHSSCMSCHQTAGSPTAPLVPEAAAWFRSPNAAATADPGLAPVRERLAWFSNVPAGVPFSDTQRTATDYSLQTSIGLQRFYLATCADQILDEATSARGVGPSPADVARSTCAELADTVVSANSQSNRVSRSQALAIALAAFVIGIAIALSIARKRLAAARISRIPS